MNYVLGEAGFAIVFAYSTIAHEKFHKIILLLVLLERTLGSVALRPFVLGHDVAIAFVFAPVAAHLAVA